MTKAQAPGQHYREHQASALHRHRKTRQPAIRQCCRHCQATGPGQPRPAMRPGAATGHERHQPIHQPRSQADVLPGNHQQMHCAAGLQGLPVFARQPRAITKHQRDQSGFAALAIHSQQALAQTVAPAAGDWRQQLPGLDCAGRTDPASQQRRFAVWPMGVEQAMRALECNGQAPTLAGLHVRSGKPAQLQAFGQISPARHCLIQLKTHASASLCWQPHHPALQPQGAAIQSGRQTVIQRLLRRPTRPAKAQQQPTQRPNARTQAAQPKQKQDQQPSDRWQNRKKTQGQQPRGERKHPCAHEVELRKPISLHSNSAIGA